MKKSLYFRHDYNARNDPKLQDVLIEHGVAGIGVFWCIVEMLYEQEGTLPLRSCKSIAIELHVDCKVVESVVNDFSLFENDGKVFWSPSAKSRHEKANEVSAKRKKAAEKRWGHKRKEMDCENNDNGNVQLPQQQIESTQGFQESPTLQLPIVGECGGNVGSEEGTEEKAEELPPKRQYFIPPTIEEVQAYINQKGYDIDAESFVAFYESKGWMIGKNKMKNWHMAVVTWSKRNNSGTSQPRQTRSATTRICNDEWK